MEVFPQQRRMTNRIIAKNDQNGSFISIARMTGVIMGVPESKKVTNYL